MNLDLYLLGRAARTAVYLIGQTLVEPDPELLAPRDLRASKPAPAVTAKRSPFTDPVSNRRRSPFRPTRTASVSSAGICRFVARRLAVPAGRIARTAFVPATASMHRWTVPSADRRPLSGTSLSGDHLSVVRGDHLGLVRLVDFRDTRREGRCQDRPWWHREPSHRYGPLTPKGEEPASWTRSSR